MARLSYLVSSCLVLLQSFASTTAIPYPYNLAPRVTRHNLTSEQARSELGPQLSKQATIFGPRDSRFANTTERYQTFSPPNIQVVVQPGAESDVAKIIKYANQNSIPFMAMNRRHALTSSVGTFSGIQIDMSLLRDIEIQPDKKTAWFQGGAYDGQVIDYLWDRGLVATTGSCTCVGMMGPGLGGGHGRYQGLYGLISDNLVNLNVVLADGTAVRINQSSHPDLWWAMQGAGHNFGVITSFELQVFPRRVDTWYYRNYIFVDAQMDLVFQEANNLYKNGTGAPGALGSVGVYSMNPQYSKDKATLTWSFIYAGSAEDAAPFLAPFDKIHNVAREEGNIPYPQIAAIQGTDDNSENCQKNRTHITTTVNLQVFNVTAQRQIYSLFNENIKKHPELSSAVATMELYSVDAVRKVPRQQSSYSQRDEFILNFFDVPFTQESSLEGFAEEWAKETRNLWNAGQPGRRPTTYLNYAFGDESLESIYGYDGQLDRLRALKHKYDPENRFQYYNPIIPPSNY
ncbi:hypothetical protein GGR51DRAFT_561393 [Nemania sp. FL0031]|nr:hypothetical protein GGR51DRAFT_561393 [Nemania sp. FL0031]